MKDTTQPFGERFEAYLKMQAIREQQIQFARSQQEDRYMHAQVVRGGVERASTDFIEHTQNELCTFFGKEVPVSPPPWHFFETRKRLVENGVTIFDPIYFPDVLFHPEAPYPGWDIRPPEWFFKAAQWRPNRSFALEQGYNGLISLPGVWGLIDTGQRPNYDDGKQIFENDPLETILSEFREKTDIGRLPIHVDQSSRFGIPSDLLARFIFPRLLKDWGLTYLSEQEKVRLDLPTVMEFNFAGNLRYPHFGQGDTSEYLRDIFAEVDDQAPHAYRVLGYRAISGNSTQGGLAHLELPHRNKIPLDSIAFRPVIKFYE